MNGSKMLKYTRNLLLRGIQIGSSTKLHRSNLGVNESEPLLYRSQSVYILRNFLYLKITKFLIGQSVGFDQPEI